MMQSWWAETAEPASVPLRSTNEHRSAEMIDFDELEPYGDYPQGDVAPIEHWQLDDFADITPVGE
jgi:hypothetical protein